MNEFFTSFQYLIFLIKDLISNLSINVDLLVKNILGSARYISIYYDTYAHCQIAAP
jgi:hypothetical protein